MRKEGMPLLFRKKKRWRKMGKRQNILLPETSLSLPSRNLQQSGFDQQQACIHVYIQPGEDPPDEGTGIH
ncbi:MAG: hypothetical protein COA94_03550 [Rickettsiales bacterium]|nr:MAG: hypothetical protein COA94_03550 [Rickettsiales bacterium]